MPTRLDWGQIGPPPSLSGLRFEPSIGRAIYIDSDHIVIAGESISYADRTDAFIRTTPAPATVVYAPYEDDVPTECDEDFYDIWEDIDSAGST
jgi:hypothetical protein